MPRFSPDQLRYKALYALEQANAQAYAGPVERTEALRFALAYLSNDAKERWPFDSFWKTLADDGLGADTGRTAGLNASLNGIYLQLGIERDHALHWRWRR